MDVSQGWLEPIWVLAPTMEGIGTLGLKILAVAGVAVGLNLVRRWTRREAQAGSEPGGESPGHSAAGAADQEAPTMATLVEPAAGPTGNAAFLRKPAQQRSSLEEPLLVEAYGRDALAAQEQAGATNHVDFRSDLQEALTAQSAPAVQEPSPAAADQVAQLGQAAFSTPVQETWSLTEALLAQNAAAAATAQEAAPAAASPDAGAAHAADTGTPFALREPSFEVYAHSAAAAQEPGSAEDKPAISGSASGTAPSIALFSQFAPPPPPPAAAPTYYGVAAWHAPQGSPPAELLSPYYVCSPTTLDPHPQPHPAFQPGPQQHDPTAAEALLQAAPHTLASAPTAPPPPPSQYPVLQGAINGNVPASHTNSNAVASALRAPWDALQGPGGAGLSSPAGMVRSATLRSTISDRRLPRVEEDSDDGLGSVRSSVEVDVPLALKLDVIAGPCSETSFVTGEDSREVSIGRTPENSVVLHDVEVSGRHAIIAWSSAARCWQVTDLGSLNGTLLNGEPISAPDRQRSMDYRLNTDDVLQVGSATRLKVAVFPREMLPENRSSGDRSGSLPFGSLPRSLTMPKHRIPSFTSLLSPKINSSPTKKAVVAAASDDLRLECCIASKTGRDHARRGQLSEDVACAECPLHGSEAALAGHPAALFCLFDGHCGRGAADAASVTLPDEVSDRLAGARAALEAGQGAAGMLHDAFLATDERIASEEGCTASAVLAWRGGDGGVYLQAANVGDSAAVLIDPLDGSWQELTEDHRLTNPRERQRLASTGIPLSDTTRRLYGLNLARALGDRFLKDEDLGLSAEPSVSGVSRLAPDQGGLVIIASDGVWDVADYEKIVAVALAADRERGGDVVAVANAVVSSAKHAGSKDDVTALVVRIWPGRDWEMRSPSASLSNGMRISFEE